jgi:hypothetical protein
MDSREMMIKGYCLTEARIISSDRVDEAEVLALNALAQERKSPLTIWTGCIKR